MNIHDGTLKELGLALAAERKRQQLSREDAAAICGVSTSFIRDAESAPEHCTLGKLTKLIHGLGLRLTVAGLGTAPTGLSKPHRRMKPQTTDFGVPEEQLVDGVDPS